MRGRKGWEEAKGKRKRLGEEDKGNKEQGKREGK
jgi:hypothetical protein